jgi:WD40 repeat protein
MVRLWDPATGQPAGPPLESRTGSVQALAAVPPQPGSRTLLASGRGRTVRLWDLASSRLVGRIARCAAVTTLRGWGGSLLAIGSADGLTVIALAKLPCSLGDDHEMSTSRDETGSGAPTRFGPGQ